MGGYSVSSIIMKDREDVKGIFITQTGSQVYNAGFETRIRIQQYAASPTSKAGPTPYQVQVVLQDLAGIPLQNPLQFFYHYLVMEQVEKIEDDKPEVEEVTIGLSAKEIKKLIRPEFQANPEKYYPTDIFKKLGFSRAQCPKCEAYYWRKSELRDTCGDSKCVGKYTFIGKGSGIGLTGKKLSYVEAWKGFEKSLTSARIPCTSISRYPVVARWRNDVDYVAAGIFCFQPYCVTGELDPPANPLICPQFCARFNDLDNIGLTGRHYSGFVMLGIQVFNYPEKYHFFKQQCVEFNYRWLTEELQINPDEITFIEDIWAGGGNLGPCVEYFVHGLELGNMVFMQYKYFPDGKYEELSIKIIDTGIGLERIPWLINGSPTSYYDIFKNSLPFLQNKLGVEMNDDIWEKLGPYSSQLNIDEVEDVDKTWQEIADLISIPVDVVKKAIVPVKDLYVILDHTRTIFMIVRDGGLPSNVGGGSNCRNILRRVFAILKKNNWWDKIGGIEGLLELFRYQEKDLQELYGKFDEYKSFNDIITIEYQRWLSTDSEQQKKLVKLVEKNKGSLSIDDWILVMQSWGIPADAISEITKIPIPGNLYYEIATRAEKIHKKEEVILYDTSALPETENLYYKDSKLFSFEGKVVEVIPNKLKNGDLNIVVLEKSAFYPISGGQQNDIGSLTIQGVQYEVLDVQKIGKAVLHFLDKNVTKDIIGQVATGSIDEERRMTLRTFHTGTHVVFAACRKVLGPHIWQNGAKKTTQNAHLDITHFTSITKEEEREIENEANRIILSGVPISKYFMDKALAEKEFGFRLYQGGIVPGNNLRVVNIKDVDVEACCGTHCDNTSEVGWIKIFKSTRISDGVVRLYYVAGKHVLPLLNSETNIIGQLRELWKIEQPAIVPTAQRFFKESKKLEKQVGSQKQDLINLQLEFIRISEKDKFIITSSEKDLTPYFSRQQVFIQKLAPNKKSVIFVTDELIFGVITDRQHLDIQLLKKYLSQIENNEEAVGKMKIIDKLKTKKVTADGYIFSFVGKVIPVKLLPFLAEFKFEKL